MLSLFKWFDLPITLFFVAVLTAIGIIGSWAYVIFLIVLMVIGTGAFVVAVLVGDYLDEKQELNKYPYFKFFIVRLVWVGLAALIFISILKLIP